MIARCSYSLLLFIYPFRIRFIIFFLSLVFLSPLALSKMEMSLIQPLKCDVKWCVGELVIWLSYENEMQSHQCNIFNVFQPLKRRFHGIGVSLKRSRGKNNAKLLLLLLKELLWLERCSFLNMKWWRDLKS